MFEEVQRFWPQPQRGGARDDAREPFRWQQAERVVEAVLVLEHEGGPQQRLVSEGRHRRDHGLVGHVGQEAPHRHVLLAPAQLGGDGHDQVLGYPRDDRGNTTRVELDRHIGEEARREPLGDLDGRGRIDRARCPGAEQRAEGLACDRRHQRRRQQLRSGGHPPQGLEAGVEDDIGDALPQRAKLLGGDGAKRSQGRRAPGGPCR